MENRNAKSPARDISTNRRAILLLRFGEEAGATGSAEQVADRSRLQKPAVHPGNGCGLDGQHLDVGRSRRAVAPFLVILVPFVGSLNIAVGLKQKDELGHERPARIRSLTASQVVNSSGCCRKCSIRRSSAAMISRDTGTSEGWASRSFHSSETKRSFSEAESCCTSGNFSRIIATL